MKTLLAFSLLTMSLVANGQNYRKVFFAMDFGIPSATNHGGVGSLTLEPSYRINDKMAVGFRIEQRGFLSMLGGGAMPLASLGLSYQYYLPTRARVFIGGGFAVFNPTNSFLVGNTDTMNERNRWGFFPRIGFDFDHFRLMAEYNFVGNMTDYVTSYRGSPMPTGQFESINKNYLNLKFGFFIGGGRKK